MKLTVKNLRSEGGEYLSIDFKKPKGFSFTVGECFNLGFNQPDFHDSRIFSFSSSPTERDLTVTFKKGYSEYKHQLEKVQPNETLEIKILGVQYSFNFDEPMIFLAGGIGIAVFHSALKYMIDQNKQTAVTLVYQNRDSSFPFKKSLEEWKKILPLTILYIETTKEGRLTKEGMRKFVSTKETKPCYVIGPPLMVDATVELLQVVGVKSGLIHTDSFDGYNEDIS